MDAFAVIPARFASTRFPGKPLVSLAGKPLIQHVYERAAQAQRVGTVLVATDDERIAEAVRAFGGEVVMTDPGHTSGTDRVAEVVRGRPEAEIVVNVQGDEPLIEPAAIDLAVDVLARDASAGLATLAAPASAEDEQDPNVVKVVLDQSDRAMYFSRSAIPFRRNDNSGAAALRHVGLYVYRRAALLRLAELPPTPLERAEALEQLRALENGMAIVVGVVESAPPGVDTPEDLERVRELVGA